MSAASGEEEHEAQKASLKGEPMTKSALFRQTAGTPSGPKQRRSLLMTYDASHFSKQPGKGPVLFVKEDQTVADAFHILTENKILSLPVRQSRGRREFYAFVDMLDILTYFVKIYGDKFVEDPEWKNTDGDLEVYARKRGQFLDHPVKDICNLSGRNKWFAIQADASLRVVIDLFAIHGVHRVPIISETGELLTIVTQSRMVQFLADHSDLLREYFPKETIGSLGLGIRPVLTVNSSELALTAFKTIQEQNISGLGVVNDAGILIGNISASDLRMIRDTSHFMEKLFLTCEDFIRDVALSRANAKIPDGPLTIITSLTLEEVFVKFAETSVHRLYILSPEGKLVGLLTLGDILASLIL